MKFQIPKVNFSFLRKIFIFAAIASFFFTGGYFFGLNAYHFSADKFPLVTLTREVPSDKETLDFSLFWRVWDTIHQKYFDQTKVVDSELIYGAISGMVSAVGDPYTVFLPPSQNKVVQEDLQGTFEGVGIQIGFKGSQLAVIAPLTGSPAEKEGVLAGDFIIRIQDEAKGLDMGTVGINLQGAVEAIRGPSNTKVTLTLLREGEDAPFEVDIFREAIDVPSVVLSFLGENEEIAHIKIVKFAGETMGEWDSAVAEIVKKPQVKSIIVDVRNNPGGYLQGAVDLASDFLSVGDTVVLEENYSGTESEYKSERIGRLTSYELYVLVNAGSASASEIFAGAIRDHNKGKLVGDTTFGKGTIQEPQQINGGSGLHITIAKWLTPKNIWVNDGGLVPDVVVSNNPETSEDEQLDEVIKILGS